jgi:serine/threonine protein kinase
LHEVFAMPCDERLIDLLQRWATADADGRSVDPAELCTSCPELLPQVERLYRFDVRLNRLLGSMSTQETCRLGETLVPGNVTALPSVPGYTVLRELAQGGMGRVYHARDTRLDRDVALKVIRSERLSADLLARFQAEARAVARLDHPHIVQVYEVGAHLPPEGGPAVPFLALEYVPGGTLESRAGMAPMPPAEAARVVALLARAMAHAHTRGVVHRDLKPANVLIAAYADEPCLNAAIGRPKVSDFGLARREAEPGSEPAGPRHTSPGAIVGTPSYMAPEQAEGQPAGPPADVYALGAILYRLLTGRVVFESASVVTTLHDVCHTPPRPPRELACGIPPALEALCLRCLAKRPSDRPSAAELAAALDHGSDTVTLPAVAPPPRRWRRWVVAVVVVLALAIPLALLAWQLLWPTDQRPAANPVQPALAPLNGYLDAQMTRPGDALRQNVAFNDPASRPLRPGDEVRVRAELNRPAHVYLVWVDSAGEVTPMYPWIDGDWKRRGPEEKVTTYKLPQVNGAWGVWTMGPGKRGLETIVLLCRDDVLPPDVDLKGLLGRFGPQPLAGQDVGVVAWFENGDVVRNEPLRAPLAKPVEGGNPLERLNREVQRRVKEHFSYTRAITYGNEGDRP